MNDPLASLLYRCVIDNLILSLQSFKKETGQDLFTKEELENLEDNWLHKLEEASTVDDLTKWVVQTKKLPPDAQPSANKEESTSILEAKSSKDFGHPPACLKFSQEKRDFDQDYFGPFSPIVSKVLRGEGTSCVKRTSSEEAVRSKLSNNQRSILRTNEKEESRLKGSQPLIEIQKTSEKCVGQLNIPQMDGIDDEGDSEISDLDEAYLEKLLSQKGVSEGIEDVDVEFEEFAFTSCNNLAANTLLGKLVLFKRNQHKKRLEIGIATSSNL